jgi:hypothetical protein
MPLPTDKRLTSRPGGAMLCVALLILCIISYAQPQASGRVINRDGTPQPGCQVEFRVGNERRYVATSDNDGRFYLRPSAGTYSVSVMRGQQRLATLTVVVDDRGGLHPSALVI